MSGEVTPFISMEVVGVRIEMPSNQPIVLLKEIDGARFLPIWVGAAEATAIAFAQQGINPDRPLTHDLMRDLLRLLMRPYLLFKLLTFEMASSLQRCSCEPTRMQL